MSSHAIEEGHQESPWMSSLGLGLLLIGFASGILVVSFIIYSATHFHQLWTAGRVAFILIAFYGLLGILAGLINSSVEGDGKTDEHAHEVDYGYGHHGSFSPIISAGGLMVVLYGFVQSYAVMVVGLLLTFIGMFNWWREDFPNDGKSEMKSLGQPFGGIDVRKVGLWVFLMSEVMIFGSFFSSYLRMRSGWLTHWNVDCDSSLPIGSAGGCPSGYQVVASEYVTHDIWTLLPGAINTFALILSSYTVVLALKSARAHVFVPSKNSWIRMWMPDRRRAVRNNLLATLALGTMFLVLKLVEWEHLIYGEDFTVKSGLPASIFYISTGAHGFHVFVGLIFLCFFSFKAHKGGWTSDNAQSIEYFGLYWHFVDLAWVAIFPAFYLY